MRILVTGGAGFIGSNFVHHILAATDHEVVTIDKLTYAGTTENLAGVLDSDRHTFVEGDITNTEIVDELVSQVEAIVNFAAESHVDRSIESTKPFVRSNIEGTQTLLDAAKKHEIDRFLQISTDEVYGEILDGTFSEADPLEPRNPYAATKAAADHLVQSYHITHDLPVLITRTCNNFGPRQHPEKLIPKFISRAAAGETLPVYGDGSNVREWIYVEDNCRAVYDVLTKGEVGEIYNIGTGEEYSNIEVTKQILEAAGGSTSQIEFVEDRAGHDMRYALETAKIESLGWEPEWNFEEGLRSTVEYYL